MDRGVSTIEVRISDAAGGLRLDRAIADAVADLSRERVKSLILAGHVRSATEATIDPSQKVGAGALFTIELPPAVPLENAAQDIPLSVAFEDKHLIVVDKPAGLVVHPAAGNPDGTLVNALLHHCAGELSGIGGVARPGIVHRIDKDTSGLIVAAKHDRAHEGLARQFKAHSIDRRYRAIVSGRPARTAGRIEGAIGRSPANRQKMAIVANGKHAVTHWSLVRLLRDAAMVECRLETGRTHQVRVHMSSIAHPLLGDPLYARSRPTHRGVLETLGFRRQALHAAHLGFIHPVLGHALSFSSEMPADMQELFDHLLV